MSTFLTIDFTNKQSQLLDEIAYQLKLTNNKNAIILKKALSLLSVVLREKKKGNRICVVKNSQILKEIIGLN